MLKKIFITIFVVFNLLAILYLVKPIPQLPDLSNSVKSNLPGDTTQIENVSAYFTNMTRTEVMNFYKTYYYGLFRINLNHPPEKSKEIIIDTIQSYYLEEFILPFRGTLYVNGFEWENDVFTKPENRIKNKLIYNNIEYKSKITIRQFPVSIPARLLSFFFTEFTIIICFYLIKSVYRNKK